MKRIRMIYYLFTAVLFLFGLQNAAADDTGGFTSFTETSDSPSTLQWSGTGILNTRYTADYDNLTSGSVNYYPELKLSADYSGRASDFHGSFFLGGYYDFTSADEISRYLDNMIDEAYFRIYLNGFDFEAGYMKIIWGKGDEIFTFDNINPVDYSDFMNNSYLERKRSEAIFKINIPYGEQGLIEVLYTPTFTPDTYPTTGGWVQNDYKVLEAAINSYTASSRAVSDVLSIEDTDTFNHSQAGIRITNSLEGIDFGFTYEYTFFREPVISPADIAIFAADSLNNNIPVTWDRIHLFGVEAAAALAGFNMRAEGAYYLTEDIKGDDPEVHNNKIQYLAGFDRDIPIHNLNINIQMRGEVILGTDNIDSNAGLDIEYSDDGTYTSHIIAADLRDTFIDDKLVLKLSSAYSIEGEDSMLIPGFEYNLTDDAIVKVRYTLYRGGEDTLFGQFRDNDMFEITCQYFF